MAKYKVVANLWPRFVDGKLVEHHKGDVVDVEDPDTVAHLVKVGALKPVQTGRSDPDADPGQNGDQGTGGDGPAAGELPAGFPDTVDELRAALKERELSTNGNKAELSARLLPVWQAEAEQNDDGGQTGDPGTPAAGDNTNQE